VGKERFDSIDIYNPAEPLQETMDIVSWMVRNAQPAVDPNRIYIVGLSSGGRAAFDATVYFPKAFAAVVPVATIYSVSRINKDNVNHYWLLYNRESMKERAWEVAQMTKKKVEELGGEFIFGQYAGKGHNAWNAAFSEPRLWDWVFAQNRDRSKTKSLNTSVLARLNPSGRGKNPPMRASSTLEAEGNNAPERAIDGLQKSMFVSTAPAEPGGYWQVEFNPAVVRSSIRILSGDNKGKRVPKGCKVMMSPFENMFPDSETIREADMSLRPDKPVRFLRIAVPKGFSGPLILREVSVEAQ
jgi:pimeloyl-ACP methyl ester carboxylesterase